MNTYNINSVDYNESSILIIKKKFLMGISYVLGIYTVPCAIELHRLFQSLKKYNDDTDCILNIYPRDINIIDLFYDVNTTFLTLLIALHIAMIYYMYFFDFIISNEDKEWFNGSINVKFFTFVIAFVLSIFVFDIIINIIPENYYYLFRSNNFSHLTSIIHILFPIFIWKKYWEITNKKIKIINVNYINCIYCKYSDHCVKNHKAA